MPAGRGAMGTSTTWRIDRNIAANDTGSQAEASSQTSAGVTSGASRVVTEVIATDRATSPRDSQVITLEAVPPGQQPTRITPTAISAGNCNRRQSSQARPGMMTNWASTPISTRMWCRATSRKSSPLSVRPMPNITRPSSGAMATVSGRNQAGRKKARMANSRTQNGKLALTKRLRAVRARMGFPCYWTAASLPCRARLSQRRAPPGERGVRRPGGFLRRRGPRRAPEGIRRRSASSG
ncbi:hypothetical protein AM469_006488 [Pseudomonas aeruginosa]|nr:hypothetical protein AM469_006488 [Pseudomonas aeruginosa]